MLVKQDEDNCVPGQCSRGLDGCTCNNNKAAGDGRRAGAGPEGRTEHVELEQSEWAFGGRGFCCVFAAWIGQEGSERDRLQEAAGEGKPSSREDGMTEPGLKESGAGRGENTLFFLNDFTDSTKHLIQENQQQTGH